MEPETFFDNEDILRFNWTVDGQHIVAVRIESQLGYQCISERQINKTIISDSRSDCKNVFVNILNHIRYSV